jgi:hypothetical protein
MKPPVVPTRTVNDLMNAKSKLGERFSPEALKKQDEEIEKTTRQPMTKAQEELEKLLFLGRVEKEVSIAKFKFKMCTLNNSQQRFLLGELTKVREEERVFFLKTGTIALSMVSINDTLFDAYIGSESDDFYARIEFFNSLQSNLIDVLFKVYGELYEESNKLLDMDEIKK